MDNRISNYLGITMIYSNFTFDYLPRSYISKGYHPPICIQKVPGRNNPCHCDSGKKYKKCCLINK